MRIFFVKTNQFDLGEFMSEQGVYSPFYSNAFSYCYDNRFYLLLGVSIMFGSMWGTGILGFSSYLRPTKKNPRIKDDSTALNNQEFHSLAKLCDEQEAAQLEDCSTINQALTSCRQEIAAFNNEIAGFDLEKKSRFKTFFNKSSDGKEDWHTCQKIEKFKELIRLMETYPAFPDDVTLDTLQTYQNESLVHHQHVIAIVETYLPDTHATLAAAKEQHSARLQNR